jgi:predicted ArsR family transcriptional regulator
MAPVSTPTSRLAAVAALADPVRRRLFLAVSGSNDGLSRDDAANALGIARATAAFHLDKLAQLGLVDVEYRRPPGRSGPGAGRPSKIYRPSATELAVSVPDRRYDLASELLAEAAARATARRTPIRDELAEVARAFGHETGRRLAATSGPDEPAPVAAALAELGYEPAIDERTVVLTNCPFHALAQRHRDLVCGMSLELVRGVLDGLQARAEAVLHPVEGRCCVRVGPPDAPGAGRAGAPLARRSGGVAAR